jgi:hypothetical protein
LGLARQRVAAARADNIDLVLDDAVTHGFPPETIDLAFTRFGVMFFADPIAAFSNIRRAMRASGRLLLTVFRSGPENPWATAAVEAIRHLVPPSPVRGPEDPGQFSWSDPARVRRILGGAGFRDVILTPFDLSLRLGADATEAAEFMTVMGQGARMLQGQPDETAQAEDGKQPYGTTRQDAQPVAFVGSGEVQVAQRPAPSRHSTPLRQYCRTRSAVNHRRSGRSCRRDPRSPDRSRCVGERAAVRVSPGHSNPIRRP